MSTYKTDMLLPINPNVNCGFGGYDISAGTEHDTVAVFFIPFKCRMKRVGMIVNTAFTGAATFKFDKETVGTESGSGAGATAAKIVGNVIIPSGTAAGKMVYDAYPMTTRIVAEPGQWIVVTLDSDPTGLVGIAQPVLIVEEVPEVAGNLTGMLETA